MSDHEPTSSRWRVLAAHVREAEAALPASRDLVRAEARFRSTLRAAPRRRWWDAGRIALPAFAALATLVLVVAGALRRAPWTAALGPEAGATLSSGLVAFDDGTELVVESEARVEARDERGARVRVARGNVRARVVHRDRTEWHFLAGSFDVRVTGTEFDLAWDPSARRVHLRMIEGSVVVTGPGLAAGRRVVAGEELQESEIEPGVSVDGTATKAATAVGAAEEAGRDSARSVRGGGAGAAVPAWRELARAGRYAAALASVERSGFDRECARAGAEDLLLLGDAARLAGAGERATTAYLLLRRRFPADRRAAAAAFSLGRGAFERGQDPEAIRWFEAALDEAPSGPFAQAALGRMMEARARLSDGPGARAAASRYLDAHPTGPHAARARRILGVEGR